MGIKDSRLVSYYIICGIIFILCKIAFKCSDNADLAFILKPVAWSMSFLSGATFIHTSANELYCPGLGIILDKSCSGVSFWIMCHILLLLANSKFHSTSYPPIRVMIGSLFISYAMTLIANTSRIYTACKFQDSLVFYSGLSKPVIHESIGVLTSIFYLILIYIAANYFLNKPTTHEASF